MQSFRFGEMFLFALEIWSIPKNVDLSSVLTKSLHYNEMKIQQPFSIATGKSYRFMWLYPDGVSLIDYTSQNI